MPISQDARSAEWEVKGENAELLECRGCRIQKAKNFTHVEMAEAMYELEVPSVGRSVVQTLLTYAYPNGDGWIVRAKTHKWLAKYSGCAEGTLRARVLPKLRDLGFVDWECGMHQHANGQETRVTTYIVRVPEGMRAQRAPQALMARAPSAHGARPQRAQRAPQALMARAPSARGERFHKEAKGFAKPTTTTRGFGGAGDGDLWRLTPEQDAIARRLARRPWWLWKGNDERPALGWLDALACRELSVIPHLTMADVEAVLQRAEQNRATLNNPAGFVIRKLPKIVHARRAYEDTTAAAAAAQPTGDTRT